MKLSWSIFAAGLVKSSAQYLIHLNSDETSQLRKYFEDYTIVRSLTVVTHRLPENHPLRQVQTQSFHIQAISTQVIHHPPKEENSSRPRDVRKRAYAQELQEYLQTKLVSLDYKNHGAFSEDLQWQERRYHFFGRRKIWRTKFSGT